MEGWGGRREWAERIELVEGRREADELVSSTRVRGAVREGEGGVLGRLVTGGVARWILEEGLYVGGEGDGG